MEQTVGSLSCMSRMSICRTLKGGVWIRLLQCSFGGGWEGKQRNERWGRGVEMNLCFVAAVIEMNPLFFIFIFSAFQPSLVGLIQAKWLKQKRAGQWNMSAPANSNAKPLKSRQRLRLLDSPLWLSMILFESLFHFDGLICMLVTCARSKQNQRNQIKIKGEGLFE